MFNLKLGQVTFLKLFIFFVVFMIIFNIYYAYTSYKVQFNGLKTKKRTSCLLSDMRINDDISAENVKCIVHDHGPNACQYTKRHYKIVEPSLNECKDQTDASYELCAISDENLTKYSNAVRCNLAICNVSRDIRLEIMSAQYGNMQTLSIPYINDSSIEQIITKVAQRSRKDDLNFLFLTCFNGHKKISQLLTFLPLLQQQEQDQRLQGVTNKININVVLLDSISRAHFYRSLPNTIKHLRVKSRDTNDKANYYDFQLFQAVHGHTHQSEHALFSGQLFANDMSEDDIQKSPVNLEILYGIFKKNGYQTMFLDDLCWQAVYGIMSKLKAKSWNDLKQKLKNSNIDSRGITESACKIVKTATSGKRSQFYDNEDHQICFNKHHQHEYLFNYLLRYIGMIEQNRSVYKPMFSYTSSHVAHDELGLRVQSLDNSLKLFINELSRKQDTISIIFADHGNTYTPYQVAHLEGRQEMYHPWLLVVIPDEVGTKLGHQAMVNLNTNQQRLVNMFDLRETLVAMATYDGTSPVKLSGLFSEKPANRTCKDMILTKEAMCICKQETETIFGKNKLNTIAEFAITKLNDLIQQGIWETNKIGQLGKCQRLHIQSILNVHHSKVHDEQLRTVMDIKVQSGTAVDQEEVFGVTVEHDEEISTITLLSYNRISKYGPHIKCADKHVPVTLCICDIDN